LGIQFDMTVRHHNESIAHLEHMMDIVSDKQARYTFGAQLNDILEHVLGFAH
jgi:hypothetical protein